PVRDARDGTVLFRHDTGGAINGGVVTYQIGGKQYIAVAAGAATRFWRAPAGSATVTGFAIGPTGHAGELSRPGPPRRDRGVIAGQHRASREALAGEPSRVRDWPPRRARCARPSP